MTFFCPSCWSEVKEAEPVCPVCGCHIENYLDGRTYARRLVDALEHKEASTPVRAAYILGMMREVLAVPYLAGKASSTSDVWLAIACVDALAKIGDDTARDALRHICNDPRPMVSSRAKALMRQISEE